MAQIGVRLTGDNADFRSMLDQSLAKTKEFSGKLADDVGGNLSKVSKVSNALATALGINLENIAQNIARTITGISKEEEEAYKKAEELSTRAADAAIANMRSRLTEEQRYQLAVKERDALLQKISETEVKSGQDLMKLNQAKLDLEAKIAETQKYEAKQAAERARAGEELAKQQYAQAEATRKTILDTLSLADRERAITQEIAGLKELLAQNVLSENEALRVKATLAERENALVKTRGDIADANAKAAEKAAEKARKSAEEQQKLEEELSKLKFESLPTEERIAKLAESEQIIRENIARLRRAGVATTKEEVELMGVLKQLDDDRAKVAKERSLSTEEEVEFFTLMRKSASGLTEEETRRLEIIKLQKDQLVINAEITTLIGKETAGTITPAERERLAYIIQQNGEIDAQIKKLKDANAELARFTVKGSANYGSMSTAALAGIQQRLEAQLASAGATGFTLGNIGPNSGDYGSYLLGSLTRQQLNAVNSEIGLRGDVNSYAKMYGEEAAVMKYGDDITGRAFRDLQDSSTRNTAATERIATILGDVFKIKL